LHDGSLLDLQKILAPLGLSSQRTEQLKSTAKVVVESYNGKIPCNKEELLMLPGVGDYTAGAVLSFAFNKPEPIVDTNVARVIVRVCGVKPSSYEGRRSPEVWHEAKQLIDCRPKQVARTNWAQFNSNNT
jgi:A/G-specific adenine glycosylase